MQTLTVRSSAREEMVDITAEVTAAVRGVSGSGLCQVFVPHTTAGVTVNENADPSVVRDILGKLARLVPQEEDYLHGEGNSDAHIKASFFGSSVTVPVESGRLMLGTWQGIYLCEFDGPRSRTVHIQVLTGSVAS